MCNFAIHIEHEDGAECIECLTVMQVDGIRLEQIFEEDVMVKCEKF